MRFMEIPPFERRVDIRELDLLVRTRLGPGKMRWEEQALALVGYMAWPNDAEAREQSMSAIRGWRCGSEAVPSRLRWIEIAWGRVADVLNHHYDLAKRSHPTHRGGPSLSKAVELVAALSKSAGTSNASLWEAWAKYKDVAHLVTAATIVTADARERAKIEDFKDCGIADEELRPLHIALLLPEVVLSVGLFLQNYGLETVPYSREESLFDPETLWRIKPDLNVTPLEPPVREINSEGIAILNARRAGNRGKTSQGVEEEQAPPAV